jgi:hypothetical protein
VTKNTVGTVEAEVTKAEFGGTGPTNLDPGAPAECTGIEGAQVTPGTLPWCVRSTEAMAEGEFQIRGGKCSEAAKKISFTLVTTKIGSCVYEATGPIAGTYVTDKVNEDAVLSVKAVNPSVATNGFTKTAGSVLCPSSGQLELAFTLETDEATVKPIYIS